MIAGCVHIMHTTYRCRAYYQGKRQAKKYSGRAAICEKGYVLRERGLNALHARRADKIADAWQTGEGLAVLFVFFSRKQGMAPRELKSQLRI